ncbi:MAG TPA: hypothetical protein VF598_05115 [Hymenobacter sp.]
MFNFIAIALFQIASFSSNPQPGSIAVALGGSSGWDNDVALGGSSGWDNDVALA